MLDRQPLKYGSLTAMGHSVVPQGERVAREDFDRGSLVVAG